MPRIKVTKTTLRQRMQALYPQLAGELEKTDALEITIRKVTRNLEQNARLHAMLGDLAKQCEVEFLNQLTGSYEKQKVSGEVWKRITLAAWFRAENETPILIVRALDDSGFDVVHRHSSKLTVEQCASYIEYLNFVGAEKGVKWTAPKHFQEGERQ